MATVSWIGGAPAVAQVQTYAFTGTWEAGDLVICTIGTKSKSVTATGLAATTVDAIVAAWNALLSTTHPEFAEITASNSPSATLRLTADTAGLPFVCTLTTTEAGGGAADDQLIEGAATATTGTAATANAGPNCWNTAANWSLAAVPVNTNDVVIENSDDDILYGLAQPVAVTLKSLTINKSFTGTIGLPRDAETYPEYRAQYLTVGLESPFTLAIGQGSGTGSGRIKINTGTTQTNLALYGCATTEETGLPAVLWKGAHISNVVSVNKGTLGVALFADETAVVATLNLGYITSVAGDADVECGSGVTLTAIVKTGGALDIASNVVTVTQQAGTLAIAGTATVTTLNLDGGTCYYESSGTMGTANVGNAGTLDFRRDMRARTVTQLNCYAGGKVYDPAATVTLTNGIDLIRCGLEDVSLEMGNHRVWTPTAI